MDLHIRPATSNDWQALEALFGDRGACGGCWCMWWRLTRAQYEASKGDGNRHRLRQLVDGGSCPGLLAFDGYSPIGWCALAPRSEFARLASSRILEPIDDRPVWSIVCFFVSRGHRNRGVSRRLLAAAIDWVRQRGGDCLEGYPVEPARDRVAPLFAYTGLASVFLAAGFREVARRSPTRPIMRLEISSDRLAEA